MTTNHDRTVLRQLMKHADELFRVRGALSQDPHRPDRDELEKKARRAVSALDQRIRELPEDTALGEFVKRQRLGKNHVLILLQLLRHRLLSDDGHLKGRFLLSSLFEGTFARLEGVRLLAPGARLLTTGIMIPDLYGTKEEEDLLDLQYRLSDHVFRFFLKILRPGNSHLQRILDAPVRTYRDPTEYVMDLRRLSLVYRKRAAKVFHEPDWDQWSVGSPDSVILLNRQIAGYSSAIRASLEATPGSSDFPLVRFTNLCKLKEHHLMILVTLLFQEMLEGNPYVDAVDLVKLVSRSEQDLFRKRSLLSPRSPLIRKGLVVMEEIVHDKALTAEVYLPNEVIDQMLGGKSSAAGTIDADTQIEFHKFLREIDDSDDFFKRL